MQISMTVNFDTIEAAEAALRALAGHAAPALSVVADVAQDATPKATRAPRKTKGSESAIDPVEAYNAKAAAPVVEQPKEEPAPAEDATVSLFDEPAAEAPKVLTRKEKEDFVKAAIRANAPKGKDVGLWARETFSIAQGVTLPTMPDSEIDRVYAIASEMAPF